MKLKALCLPVILGGALAAIYLLPKVGAVAQSAVNMTLPETTGQWVLRDQPASKDEINTLAADTTFSKAICFSPRPGEYNMFGERMVDSIQLSIVLSGSDINNSIHRPERCMPAQGHNITSSSDQVLKLSNGREFPVKRLVSIQLVRNTRVTDREVYDKYDCLTYYFFVGHNHVTSDHLERTFIDIKDRLVYGMDQRWAYASASMWYGKVPGVDEPITQEEADAKLQKFLENLAEKQIDWAQIAD
jgi:hypothetical protein